METVKENLGTVMVPAVASIVPKLSSTVPIKSPGSAVHCFVRSGRLYGKLSALVLIGVSQQSI